MKKLILRGKCTVSVAFFLFGDFRCFPSTCVRPYLHRQGQCHFSSIIMLQQIGLNDRVRQHFWSIRILKGLNFLKAGLLSSRIWKRSPNELDTEGSCSVKMARLNLIAHHHMSFVIYIQLIQASSRIGSSELGQWIEKMYLFTFDAQII